MRECLIIIIALIGAGFIVYLFDRFRNLKFPESKPNNEAENWDSFWAFLFPIIGFIMALWFLFKRHGKRRARTCAMWALGGMAFNAIWYLLFR